MGTEFILVDDAHHAYFDLDKWSPFFDDDQPFFDMNNGGPKMPHTFEAVLALDGGRTPASANLEALFVFLEHAAWRVRLLADCWHAEYATIEDTYTKVGAIVE
jgi:hypothetical protein